MNISKPFVTESRSHAKKIISKGFEVERLSQRKAIFPQEEVKKKKDNDLNNILSLPCLQRNSIKLLFISKALILRH